MNDNRFDMSVSLIGEELNDMNNTDTPLSDKKERYNKNYCECPFNHPVKLNTEFNEYYCTNCNYNVGTRYKLLANQLAKANKDNEVMREALEEIKEKGFKSSMNFYEIAKTALKKVDV